MTGERGRNRPIGRADLLRAIGLAESDEDAAQIASFLGYEGKAVPADDREQAFEPQTPAGLSAESATAARSWRVEHIRFTALADAQLVESESPSVAEPHLTVTLTINHIGRDPEALLPPPPPPIISWPLLRRAIEQVVHRREPRGEVDVDTIVATFERGDMLTAIPHEPLSTRSRRLVMMPDFARRLFPIWEDQLKVCECILDEFGRGAIECHVCPHPLALHEHLERDDVLLVMGDLGQFGDVAIQQAWAQAGANLRQRGVDTCALMACPVNRWNGETMKWWRGIDWASPAGVRGPALTQAQIEERRDQLLALLSWTVRLEPELLRHVRSALSAGSFDLGTELDVWNHPEARPHKSGLKLSAALRQASMDRLQAMVKQQKLMWAGDVHRVREIVRVHHAALPKEIYTEELQSLESLDPGQGWIEEDDRARVIDFYRRLSGYFVNGGELPMTINARAWARRSTEARVYGQAWDNPDWGVYLKTVFEKCHESDEWKNLPRGLTLDKLTDLGPLRPLRRWAVFQVHDHLEVLAESDPAALRESPLVTILARAPRLAVDSLVYELEHAPVTIVALPETGVMTLATDCASYELHRGAFLFEGPGGMPVTPVPYFAGRLDELGKLEQALTEHKATCVVVTGLGGSGKTTLVRQFVATRAAEWFPDGSAWLDANNLKQDLERVCRRLGWSGRRISPDEAAMWLALTLSDLRFLLVVDGVNAEDMAGVPRLGGGCRTLVTSRERRQNDPSAIWVQLVAAWSMAESIDYLRTRCGRRLTGIEDEELVPLLEFVGRLPLSVRLLASVLLNRPMLRPEETLATLRMQSAAVNEMYQGQNPGLVATFQSIYDALSDQPRRVLKALAVCAPQTHTEVVGAVAEVDDVEEVLYDLQKLSLVDRSDGANALWQLHSMLRVFVLAQPGLEAFESAHTVWVETHLEVHTDVLDHIRPVEEALEALRRLVKEKRFSRAMGLYRAVEDYFRRIGSPHQAMKLSQQLLDVVPGESEWAAESMSRLGLCYQVLGEIPKAIEYFERSLAVYEGLGRLDGQAGDLINLGLCYRALADIPKAIEYFERSLAVYERLGGLDGQAGGLANLGLCYQSLADIPKATEYFERSLAVYERLGGLEEQAGGLANLSLCYRTLADISKAREYSERSLAIYERLGQLEGQANQIVTIGIIASEQGDATVAREYLMRAETIFRRIGVPEDHPQLQSTRAALRNLVSVTVDVGVLIALEEEFRELERELGENWEPRHNEVHGGYDYFWIDERGGYRCVATYMGGMDPDEVARGVDRLLRFRPALFVSIGIAAGLSSDVRIGDVVVPSLIWFYDQTWVKDFATLPDRLLRSRSYRTEPLWIDEARHLRFAHPAVHRAWQEAGANEMESVLKANEAATRFLGHTALRARPEICVASLASGSRVAAGDVFSEWLRETNGDLGAIEMGAAGMLLAATKHKHVRILVIRGISDHVTLKKAQPDASQRGALRRVAMRNAWRLLATLMELGVLPRLPVQRDES